MRAFAQQPKSPQPAASAKSAIFAPHLAHSGEANAFAHAHRAVRTHARGLAEAETTAGEGRETFSTAPLNFSLSRIPAYAPAPSLLQTKLALGTPGDIHEQEADRVADQVMRMPEPQRASAAEVPVRAGAQNSAARVQTKSAQANDSGGAAAPPIVHEVLRSPGQPLDAATRAFMEPRFRRDFGDVRVHANAKAAESARMIDARAYTLGRDVVLGAGASVSGGHGRALVAHELAHVMQQDHATIRRQPENKTGKDDDTKGLSGEKLIVALIGKLKSKTYKQDEAAGAEAKEKFGRDATRDAYELAEKVDDDIRTYLRSPAGTALLGTLDDLPRGHALRLFARDWRKAEVQREKVESVFGRRPGAWLYKTLESNSDIDSIAGYVGTGGKAATKLFITALGNNSSTSDFAEANKAPLGELPGFVSSIAKDLAGKPLFMKRAVKWAQFNLIDPDVLVPALMASVPLAGSPFATKLIDDAYTEIGKKKLSIPADLGGVHFDFSGETKPLSYSGVLAGQQPLSLDLVDKAGVEAAYKGKEKNKDTSATLKVNYDAAKGTTGEQLIKWGTNSVKFNETFGADPKFGWTVGSDGYESSFAFGLAKGSTDVTLGFKQDPKKLGKNDKLGFSAGLGFKDDLASVSGSVNFQDANRFKVGAGYQGKYGPKTTHELSGYASKGFGSRYNVFADVAAKFAQSGAAEIDARAGLIWKIKKDSKYALVGQSEVTKANSDAVVKIALGLSYENSGFLFGVSNEGKFEVKWYKALTK